MLTGLLLQNVLRQCPPTAQVFFEMFQHVQLDGPLVRFIPDLQLQDLTTTHTVMLSATELWAHKNVLSAHLAHNPEHRIHVVLGDGPFMDGDRLTMKKDNLPAGLQHLTLSDPQHLVQKINHSFLCEHENLRS